MKTKMTTISAVILAALLASTSANAIGTGNAEALKEIRITAQALCVGVNDLRSEHKKFKITASAKAKVGGLIGKLVKIKAGVNTKYEKETHKGLLMKDVALAINAGLLTGGLCRLEVLHVLADRILIDVNQSNMMVQQRRPLTK